MGVKRVGGEADCLEGRLQRTDQTIGVIAASVSELVGDDHVGFSLIGTLQFFKAILCWKVFREQRAVKCLLKLHSYTHQKVLLTGIAPSKGNSHAPLSPAQKGRSAILWRPLSS